MDASERVTAPPIGVFVFAALGIGMTVLAIVGIAPSLTGDPARTVYAVVGAVPTAIAFFLPAALFLRHRHIWTTNRVLVVGVVLFGVVEVLQFIAPGLSEWFRAVIPPPDGFAFLAPLDVAYTVVVGILAAMAPIYTGRGLLAGRAYEDEPPARRWWWVVVALTLVAGVTNVLNLVNLSLDVPADALMVYFWLTVLSVIISLLSLVGWAYLTGVALVGWRSVEAPTIGWMLAGLAGLAVLVGLAVSGVIATIGVFATPLPGELSIGIVGAFALGYVLLLAAFMLGLPEDVDD